MATRWVATTHRRTASLASEVRALVLLRMFGRGAVFAPAFSPVDPHATIDRLQLNNSPWPSSDVCFI
jgi:hypothetical protein